MTDPHNPGYKHSLPVFKFEGISEDSLEMLKIAFCLVLATWMTGCLMAIVYAREIAQFIVERAQ